MPFNPGNFNFTGVTCPDGTSLEYSIDGGTTYSTTEPSYPNDSAQSFELCVRCVCLGTDPGPSTCVQVNSADPSACCPTLTTPTAPVVTDSTCS